MNSVFRHRQLFQRFDEALVCGRKGPTGDAKPKQCGNLIVEKCGAQCSYERTGAEQGEHTMNLGASLLFLTQTPDGHQDLVSEAARAGFDVDARPPMPDPPRRASEYDIIAYDWSDGLPGDCALKVERFLDDPGRTSSVVALVHPPQNGNRCQLFPQLDDIVFPPYEPREVVARFIRIAERRKGTNILTADDIRVDLDGHEVTVNGDRVPLTHTEFLVLAHLVSHRGRVVTRHELARAVWGGDINPNADALDVHVRRMRGKLRTAGSNPLETVRKVGYRYAR
jgi:DNA-binding response OmpR family regulator